MEKGREFPTNRDHPSRRLAKRLPTPTFHPYSHHLTCFLITITLLFNTYGSLINFSIHRFIKIALQNRFKSAPKQSFLANTRSMHYFIKVFQYPGVVETPPVEVHSFRCRRLPIQPSSAHHPGVNSGESPVHRDGPNASIEMADICVWKHASSYA